ncbi:MAG: MFS transporter [Oscillospiraceae bacterium]|nr:MFS transporter [Oscillospiraceae bacterium]
MNTRLTYNHTITACFIGYIVQAIVNNFVPLLFLTFQSTYGISLPRITLLVTLNFGIQLSVDLLSAFFADRIGYRLSMCGAHLCVAVGFIMLAVLPNILPDPYIGIMLAVIVYAIGGGLLEVVVSPVVEACPTEHKESAMSLLHSFYCWGQMGVVLISTAFFAIFGIEHWRILTVLWIAVALGNMVFFTRVPIASLIEDGGRGLSFRELLSKRVFWLLLLMMVCAGAAELTVSQWASTLAEKGLGVSKTIGDLAGPMAFAALMGTSRVIYGKFGSKLNLDKYMSVSCILCVIAYLLIAVIPNPVVNLAGCAVCGFSVGIMWPGSFSKASAALPLGGTLMFALLALGGDIGCSVGPTFAGLIASVFGDNLQMGILFAAVFPIGLYVLILLTKAEKRGGLKNE